MNAIAIEKINGTYHMDHLITEKEVEENIKKDYPKISKEIILYENSFLDELEYYCKWDNIILPYQKVNGTDKYLYRDNTLKEYLDISTIINDYQEYREQGEPCGNRLYLTYENNLLTVKHMENDGVGPFEVLDYKLFCTDYEFAELMVTYLEFKKQFDLIGVYVSFKLN